MLNEAIGTYSGGLSKVSGYQTKAANNLGVSMFGVGFLGQQGYFRQEIVTQRTHTFGTHIRRKLVGSLAYTFPEFRAGLPKHGPINSLSSSPGRQGTLRPRRGRSHLCGQTATSRQLTQAPSSAILKSGPSILAAGESLLRLSSRTARGRVMRPVRKTIERGKLRPHAGFHREVPKGDDYLPQRSY